MTHNSFFSLKTMMISQGVLAHPLATPFADEKTGEPKLPCFLYQPVPENTQGTIIRKLPDHCQVDGCFLAAQCVGICCIPEIAALADIVQVEQHVLRHLVAGFEQDRIVGCIG